MKIYGFHFVLLRLVFSPLLNLACNTCSSFQRKSAPTFCVSYRAGNARKWMYTICIRRICLSTQSKCRQFMPAFVPSVCSSILSSAVCRKSDANTARRALFALECWCKKVPGRVSLCKRVRLPGSYSRDL